ncbi:GDSL-type esterase/lipase family protein [Halobacteria archaeon AArc-m2/3/4]|uniref:GDSL-type esterase/lipase family protein n=1 Tax=Natronoglomus mannanivorans TaxID=2979990 RepID=A0AAP3E326_9EURY|nr:GDSL-type esterase/lipase family protein [Halobacteria archaeon AArc-xg1-1]MCU4974108.1 GDSL-type esterase/lipase family protein [Halobacteria archaeon AArc-m2/3/4]
MELEEYPSVSLHNVAETVPAEWNESADRLCRIPAAVGAELNEMACDRVRHPTGSEIRFVPEADAEVEITLSAPESTQVHPFWGPFQPWEPIEIGPTPQTLTFSVPDRLRELTVTDETGRFDPTVCRILLERVPAVALHDVTGDCRPPTADELPDRRYLAYGTSITEGAAASTPHTNYVTHVARGCGYDALNFGCSGSAYCESAMAEYIASRGDWDVATLAMSVNMANAEFTVAEFHERVETFVETIASAHPRTPIACVTLFPYFADVTESGDADRAEAFREAVRTVVADSSHTNLSLVEGTDLLELPGLTADVLHPGDDGMEAIGEGLARHLEQIVG